MLINCELTLLLGVCKMAPRLRPIGHIITSASHEELGGGSVVSKIVIDPEFAGGLEGLEDYSHLYVLFWLQRIPRRRIALTVHPRGRKDVPKVGVFATRSPHRPNPIGLTLVKLLSKKGRVLTVKGLDAYDGTPVLDLKPRDRRDSPPRLRVPAWWRKLERERRNTRIAPRVSVAGRAQRIGMCGSKTR